MDMDSIKKLLAGNKTDLLMAIVGLEGIVTFAFVICTFAVATTANAGFNVVLTGFLNIGFIAGSYHVIRKSKAPIAVGFLIGSGFMMTLLNFMTAIYWGQLSLCESVSSSVSQYSCNNRVAYGAVCFFSVVLFLLQMAFTAGVTLWRGELMNDVEGAGYDEISSHSTHNNPYDTPGGQFSASADL